MPDTLSSRTPDARRRARRSTNPRVAHTTGFQRALQSCLRAIVGLLARIAWRPRATGLERLPAGGAVLVANHVSYVDALLVGMAARRTTVFLMQREFFDVPIVGWVARACGALPIARGDSPLATARVLELAAGHARAGELVCIFAEGGITRDGALQPFHRGLEVIARAAEVPIVPVHLAGLARSWFGYGGGPAFRKLPRFGRSIEVRFGESRPSDSPAWRIERAVAALAADAATERAARGDDLGSLFLRSAKNHSSREAIVDGATRSTYARLAVAALAFARRSRRELHDEERVAVLLPPGAAGAIVNLALALDGRASVNLNALLSNEELARCADAARTSTLITSRRVLAALQRSSPLEPERGRTLFVEDLLASLSIADRVRAWLGFRMPQLFARRRAAASAPATLVFSSGSTARPKCAVLTHANVVSNVRAVAELIGLAPSDRLLGVLPLFHSFGYTIGLFAPLSRGAAIVAHASPLDAKTVVELAERERTTILLGTPFFLKTWMRRATPQHFASVRLAVSGAERLPLSVAESWRERFGARLVEGYGATELSPVACVGLDERTPQGSVGRALPGVALRVVDRESDVDDPIELGPDREGLLLVRGPNVFAGYFGAPNETRAVLRDGWYSTGDIARIDVAGNVTLVDRAARFAKIGGEMVSHARIEDELRRVQAELGGAAECELAVTSLSDVERGERLVVVHTALGVSIDALLERLNASALPKLFIPRRDAFVEVASLPKLASGKLDLVGLAKLATP